MEKPTRKYDWKAFPLWMIMSAVFILFVALISNSTTPMSLLKGFAMLGAYLALLVLGLALIIRWSSILNRKVDHPVLNPEKMIVGHRYWLNGETWADYIGQDVSTKLFVFAIYGENNPKKPYTVLYRGDVCRYISESQEVFEQ